LDKNNDKPGRLVLNHSTHIKGLIKALEKLCLFSGIDTITPGRINQTKSRPCKLKLSVTVPTIAGFKIQARSERAAQEVFIVTRLSKEDLQAAIDKIIP
jgi:hypothetical protein